jgi:hypothetical protein
MFGFDPRWRYKNTYSIWVFAVIRLTDSCLGVQAISPPALARSLLFFSFPEESGKIIVHLRKRDLSYRTSPNCASHDSASDLATIARISTVASLTSWNTRTSPIRSLNC